MKVGDLVKLRIAGSELYNKVGILLELTEPSILFPCQTATIMLADGSCEDGIATICIEVIDNPGAQK